MGIVRKEMDGQKRKQVLHGVVMCSCLDMMCLNYIFWIMIREASLQVSQLCVLKAYLREIGGCVGSVNYHVLFKGHPSQYSGAK